VGVGPERGTKTFYRSSYQGCSSFDKDNIVGNGHGSIVSTIEVDVVTITDIVETHCAGEYKDLLSIDIEGWDLAVLSTINFDRAPPTVICVEAIVGGPHSAAIRELLEANGYFFCIRARNNAMFVRNECKAKMF
jgi:hypothetical protein